MLLNAGSMAANNYMGGNNFMGQSLLTNQSMLTGIETFDNYRKQPEKIKVDWLGTYQEDQGHEDQVDRLQEEAQGIGVQQAWNTWP